MVQYIMQAFANNQPTFPAGDSYRNPYVFYADVTLEVALFSAALVMVGTLVFWLCRKWK